MLPVRTVAFVAVAVVLAATVAAHEGHTHRILGTIASLEGDRLGVETTKRIQTVVVLNDKTKILKGKAAGTRADLKPGLRVVVEAEGKGEPMTARTIRLPSA
jgi:hypothetical protein